MLRGVLTETEDDRCNSINWDKKYHIILSSFLYNRTQYTQTEAKLTTEQEQGSLYIIKEKEFTPTVLVYLTQPQFFKQKKAYEILRSLVGSQMCIRDSS